MDNPSFSREGRKVLGDLPVEDYSGEHSVMSQESFVSPESSVDSISSESTTTSSLRKKSYSRNPLPSFRLSPQFSTVKFGPATLRETAKKAACRKLAKIKTTAIPVYIRSTIEECASKGTMFTIIEGCPISTALRMALQGFHVEALGISGFVIPASADAESETVEQFIERLPDAVLNAMVNENTHVSVRIAW